MARKPPKNNVPAADDQEAIDNNPQLQQSLERGGVAAKTPKGSTKKQPIYKVVGDSKIPVSKSFGKMAKGRIDAAKAARKEKGIEEVWREAVRYYCNDQMKHRDGIDSEASGNRVLARRVNDAWTETENVVFANTSTMLPVLYAKNPQCEVTATNQDLNDFADALEDFINAIIAMKAPRGINLKPKARRCVLTALLTNRAYIKIGYTFKDMASDEAVKQLNDLAKQWENAKSAQDIEVIEGRIQALEDVIELTQPEGHTAKVVSPFNIFVDPESEETDFSDANWMTEVDFLPTAFVNAKYLKQVDGKEYASLFEPTHIIKAGTDPNSATLDDEVSNFSLFEKEDGGKGDKYGYDSDEAYERAKMTKVWWYWDKTTKRLFLFHDKDFTWPLWVWDDPYKLTRFFPYYCLEFHVEPEGGYSKGEVTYYLDQQDAINEINDAERRARGNVKNNLFFNSAVVDRDTVEQVLKGADGTARGIDLGEDGQTKLGDVLFAWAPDYSKHAELFQGGIDRKLQAIARISSVNSVLAGQEFKTNTTNKAVDSYQMATEIRVDEKTDLIEDWLGDICLGLMELCVQYCTPDRISSVIGRSAQQYWSNMSPDEMYTTLNFQVVGGSTDKPTSRAKKKEAIELGQVLGQFVQASPAVVMVMLKVMEQAFDEVVMTDEMWKAVEQGVAQAMAPKPSTDVGQNGAPAEGDQGSQPSPEAQAQVQQAIAKLPPAAKQKLEELVQRGMRPSQALQTVMQAVQNVQQTAGNA